jgi:calcineurin-like phosphoesterase family protein
MSYWLISDTHFNHKKIEEFGQRSGTWETQLYEGISHIPGGDTLVHLGDVSIGQEAEAHKQLKDACGRGENRVRMVLVRGNHDNRTLGWYLEHGWDFVCDSLSLSYMGEKILMSHRPVKPGTAEFSLNIHGHTHGNMHRGDEHDSFYDPEVHLDISPELVGFAPLKLETIIKRKIPNYGKHS